MIKKLMSIFLAIAIAAGVALSTSEPAEAQRRGGAVAAGVAAGIIGLGILGAAAAANQPRYYATPACYHGPRECHYTGDRCWYNRYGEYVCRRGNYQCHRPLICP